MKKLLILCLLLTGCGIGGLPDFSHKTTGKTVIQPDTISMLPAAWVINQIAGQSWNMPVHPVASGKGWTFDFPSQDGVHYVRVPYHANKSHANLTITYRVTGSNFVSVQTGCNEEADFRPMLQRVGDTMTVDKEFYRWWSAPPVKLVGDGQVHTMTYALQWSNWTSVFGKKNQTEFETSMKNLGNVGITFGGGCAAGHGVYGSGRFEMLNFEIQ